MAVWMELRCDYRSRDTDLLPRCLSHVNAGPTDMATNTSSSVSDVRRSLLQDAKNSGWRRFGVDWACPACASLIGKGKLPAGPHVPPAAA